MEIKNNHIIFKYNEEAKETSGVVNLKDGQEILVQSKLGLVESIPFMEKIILNKLLELYAN